MGDWGLMLEMNYLVSCIYMCIVKKTVDTTRDDEILSDGSTRSINHLIDMKSHPTPKAIEYITYL